MNQNLGGVKNGSIIVSGGWGEGRYSVNSLRIAHLSVEDEEILLGLKFRREILR